MNLVQFYHFVRHESMAMVDPLHIEDFIPQATYFTSPPKWNLGHTTWFFEELILKRFVTDYKVFDERYGYMFNSYYNTLGNRVDRDRRGDFSRPTVQQVYDYRAYVDNMMEHLLNSKEQSEDLAFLVTLGLNHEQQHQELFYTDLKYTFAANPLYPKYSNFAYCEGSRNEDSGFVKFNEGVYKVGYDFDNFHYDNEAPAHQVYLSPFSISKSLITNGEYKEFIEDGGYGNVEYWHDEAISWLRENKITQPMYWVQKGTNWFQYTLAGLREIHNNDILTHINYYEAYAFAQWKGMRLPTEFEWEVAADSLLWGRRWEWTESAYLPYPGYIKGIGALGEYNGKFMVNQKVLRGASVVTPKGHERKTYRNFFHPNLGYQFTGIRLAK